MIRQIIEEELEYERKLQQNNEDSIPDKNRILIYSCGCFRYRDISVSEKFRYIKKNETALLRSITEQRYRTEKSKILKTNISILESALSKLSDYDDETIINKLPKAYSTAVDLLREDTSFNEVLQSENPKYREQLIVKASDGLKVRTKGELNLYETMKFYEKVFRMIPQIINTF